MYKVMNLKETKLFRYILMFKKGAYSVYLQFGVQNYNHNYIIELFIKVEGFFNLDCRYITDFYWGQNKKPA